MQPPRIIRYLAAWISRWALHHESLILDAGRALTERELEWARTLGIQKPAQVRIHVVDRVPVPFWNRWVPTRWIEKYALKVGDIAGMTLGYGIYVREGEESPLLVAHELVHVQQYERLGGFQGFMAAYLLDCFHHGYQRSHLEAEAVQRSVSLFCGGDSKSSGMNSLPT